MLSKLKKLYCRIVPASKFQIKKNAEHMNKELSSLSAVVSALNQKIEEAQKDVSKLQDEMQSADRELKQIRPRAEADQAALTGKLNAIASDITRQAAAAAQVHTAAAEERKNTVRLINEKEEQLSAGIRGLDKRVEALDKRFGALGKQMEGSGKRLGVLDQKLERLAETTHSKYLYYNEYERRVIQSFHDMYHRPDYREHFLALVSGLETEDVNKIVRILKRQQDLEETGGHIDLFTEEEQQQIKTMLKSFEQEIFRVDDGLFIYRNYRLPVNHFEASVFYYKHGLDEVRNLAYTYDKDIVDVGGFIGDSVLVLEPYTTKRIYTFEAVRSNFELLQKTIEINGLKNVVAENLALGREETVLEMQVAGSASTLAAECPSTVFGTEQVKVIRFDDYVKQNNLQVGLIKIDIEGAEQDFLAGAKETILSQRPILLCSIYHNADDFFHIKPLLESWNAGYKFHIHKPVDKSVSREVLLIAEPDV